MRTGGSGNLSNRTYGFKSFHRSIHSHRSLDFMQYAADGNRFINEVSEELGVDRDSAARITRAVLHALRDRIPVDDAIQFAQGLPMALKGIFIDRYDPSDSPVVIRSVDEFLDYIYYKDGNAAPYDFTSRDSIIYGLQAVVRVLMRTMDRGQVTQIMKMINKEIRMLIDDI